MTLMFERLIAATVFITIALAGASPGALADTDDAGAQKAILVTGASSGIGRNIAETLAAMDGGPEGPAGPDGLFSLDDGLLDGACRRSCDRLGMFFGTGAIINGIEHFHAKFRSKGLRGGLGPAVSAVRILVGVEKDCYAALGIVHGLWRHIPKEFDDYIATPLARRRKAAGHSS